MQEILDYSIFGNTTLGYLSSLGIFIGAVAAVYPFKRYILSRLKNWAESTDTSLDDLMINAVDKSLVPVFYFGVLYMAMHTRCFSQRNSATVCGSRRFFYSLCLL